MCIKLGVLLYNYTVFIEILACIKTFVKATTSNTSKLRAVFCMGQYKKSRKYFIALECKN